VLGGSGAELFEKAMDEMRNAAGATQTAFEIMMDTPEKRWTKALNTMKNADINLGTAILPIAEKVIGKISGTAGSLAQIDFSKYTESFEKAFNAASGFISILFDAVETAWQFRDVIIAIVAPIATYNLLLMAAVPLIGLFTKLSFIAAFTMGTQATALGMLKKGTAEYLIVNNLFTAATAKMAVATGTATKGQWLLNAAMTANPIGLVIGIVLILILKELFSNWDNIAKAFKDGGILAGILRIGGTIVSAILSPIQALLELLSNIPGLGDLVGKGAEQLQKFRNFLKGTNDAANTAQNRKANKKTPADEIDELMRQYGMSGMDYPGFGIPDFGGASAGGKSKLHGVVDISGGAGYSPANSGAYTAAGALVGNTPPSVPAIPETLGRAAIDIAAILRKMDNSVLDISRNLPLSARFEIPELTSHETATRTSLVLPQVNAGGGDDAPGYFSPRGISPITQA
jgi:hypothetical protein